MRISRQNNRNPLSWGPLPCKCLKLAHWDSLPFGHLETLQLTLIPVPAGVRPKGRWLLVVPTERGLPARFSPASSSPKTTGHQKGGSSTQCVAKLVDSLNCSSLASISKPCSQWKHYRRPLKTTVVAGSSCQIDKNREGRLTNLNVKPSKCK